MKIKAFYIQKRIIYIINALLLCLASYQSQANDVTLLPINSCYDNPGTMRYDLYPDVDLYNAPIGSIVGEVIVDAHFQCHLASSVIRAIVRQVTFNASPWVSPSAIGAYELVMVSTNPASPNHEFIDDIQFYQPSSGKTWYIDEPTSNVWFLIKKVQEIKPNERFPNYTDNSGWYIKSQIGLWSAGFSSVCSSCYRQAVTIPGVHLHEFVAVDESCEILHPNQIPLPTMAKGRTAEAHFNISVSCTDKTIDKNLEFAFEVISANANYSSDFYKSIHSGAGLPTVEMSLESHGSPVKFVEPLVLNVDQSGPNQQEYFIAKFESIDGLGDYSYTLNVWVSYN